MTGPDPRLLLHGAGRMGRLVHDHAGDFGFTVAAVVAPERPPWLEDARYASALDSVSAADGDVLVDFTLPAGLAAAAAWSGRHGKPLVSGTTGLGPEHERALDAAAERAPVLHAANFSLGVNTLLWLVSEASRLLGERAGAAAITDVHHRHKKDAPSGTALALRDALGARPCEIESRREGEVVGDHAVRFDLEGERLTLAHHAGDRAIFARGALQAARWLLDQPPGRYTSRDWLGVNPR
ncbi:MAG: dihydrodipicolinate reductase C-terminal domain-containing protein [Gammaproteobacteria bacterium]